MQKKTLLIVIDNLKKGGAEVLLVGILSELNKKYSVILVTLTHECDFQNNEIHCEKNYILGFKNKLSVFSCVWKLKKIIKKFKPCLIHSHLFYSSLIARIACPRNINLIYSLHGEMSKNVFNNSKILTFLEKNTIKKNHSIIAVSSLVLKDYHNTIRKTKNSFVLPNYISDQYFEKKNFEKTNHYPPIKLVAVGNVKRVKNYIYLLNAFEELVHLNISLDIIGEKNEEELKSLADIILKKNLKIAFKGKAENIHVLLPTYDLYVSCSLHEGFGIAAIEAMASGLPLLLSDLPVYHEVTNGNALFFDHKNPKSFVELIKRIFEGKYDLNLLSQTGVEIAKQYNRERYLSNLYSIYDEIH